jgi:hypothetical protein
MIDGKKFEGQFQIFEQGTVGAYVGNDTEGFPISGFTVAQNTFYFHDSTTDKAYQLKNTATSGNSFGGELEEISKEQFMQGLQNLHSTPAA